MKFASGLLWALPLALLEDAAGRSTGSDGPLVVSENAKVNTLVNWVVNKPKGYFSSKQLVKQADSTEHHDGSEIGLGVFAQQKINRGELLARIPWELVMGNTGDNTDSELPCALIRLLVREMTKGEQSSFAPFIDYLQGAKTSHIPSGWSEAGKGLLSNMMIGTTKYNDLPPVEPVQWLEKDWAGLCSGGDSPIEKKAALTVISRADDGSMVPLYDLYNHIGGSQENVNIKLRHGTSYELYASKTVKAGEQLFLSYTNCPSCEREHFYGTPEIFRDYGFIEDYPQRWAFYTDDFDVERLLFSIDKKPYESDGDDEEEDTMVNLFTITWEEPIFDSVQLPILKSYIARLGRLRSDELAAGPEVWALARNSTEIVPQHEWTALVAYIDAMILALSHAIYQVVSSIGEEAAAEDGLYGCIDEVDDTCLLNQLYSSLETAQEIYQDRRVTCDVAVQLDFSDYAHVDDIRSEYQHILFTQNTGEDQNVCMELDGIVQICDNYRPHYHEYAVNHAARYLRSVKRVAFIGGGDNMILQELLKYPDLELAIGLELDQAVVRNSFKWFHTDPHFHDDRVEWWFGDATKSLLLLPKEYLNSFDFVMVDVSETGASMTVTDHLDIFNAMALLVKPDGIMVKNEPYFRQMSKAFDYSVDVHFYHNPMICDQSMILGSNHIDFFHEDNLTDHHVKNLLLPEIEDYPHQYLLWRDYKINDPIEDGSCARLEAGVEDQKQSDGIRKGKSEGMLMIVEVEKCTVNFDQVESILVKTLDSLGFASIISENNSPDTFDIVIVMSEGYVVARKWSEHKYIALDIHLWGRFDLMDATRAVLVKALGSGNDVEKGSTSSFRIVVSGMYGNDSWAEDTKLIGPDLTKSTRKCDLDIGVEEARKVEETEVEVVSKKSTDLLTDDFLTASLGLIVEEMATPDLAFVVFCGAEGSECLAVVALDTSPGVGQVIPVYICPEMATFQFGDSIDEEELHLCRRSIEQKIRSVLKESDSTIEGAMLDSSAPYAMGRIFSSFWTFRRSVFQDSVIHLYVSIQPDSTKDEWRRNAVLETRQKLDVDPLTRTELLVKPKGLKRDDGSFVFNILNVDTENNFPKVRSIEDSLLKEYGSEVNVAPTVLEGGTLMYFENDEFYPINFDQSDYDLSVAKEQLKKQRALGRQSIYQLGRDRKHRDSSPNVDIILTSVLESQEFTIQSTAIYGDKGEGVVVVARCEEGTVIAVWDGRDHIVLNAFQIDQRRESADKFLSKYLATTSSGWVKELRDDMPRGINRVINFETGDST